MYSIRISTKDSGGLTFEKAFTLNVSDLNEMPTNISLSTTIFNENIAEGSIVAALHTSDPDFTDDHSYALISGDGDADNSAFTIEGDQLKIDHSPDFEEKSSYSIRLESKDTGGLAPRF